MKPTALRNLGASHPFSSRSSRLPLCALLLAGGSLAATALPAAAQLQAPTAAQVDADLQRLPGLSREAAQAGWGAYLDQVQTAAQAARRVNPGVPLPAPLARQVNTAALLTRDLRAANLPASAWWMHYTVPALSPVMRLPDTYAQDGIAGGEVRVVLAQDEYEPGSFVVYPLGNQDNVQLRVGELRNAAGNVLPPEAVDLKVVKVWYQNGNGWYSYFADVNLALVPELLLHDENLIRVDTSRVANYARVQQNGKTREVWISAPTKMDPGFDPYTPGFTDAPTLQPVQFVAGQGKQFVLTVHAAPDTAPGLYRGQINVEAAGKPAGRIPVAVKVLPFRLPLPKTNFDTKRDMLVTVMGAWPKLPPGHPAKKPTLLNLRRHNVLTPRIERSSAPSSTSDLDVQAYKEAGFSLKPILGGSMMGQGQNDRPPLTYEDLKSAQKAARVWREFYLKHFGHTDAAVSFGDEQASRWLMTHRPLWRILHEAGLKTYIAGHNENDFYKAGYILDVHPTAGSPGQKEKSEPWNAVGGSYTSFYANQHTGAENPDLVRRQHGLLTYLSNFDMVNNYEFAYGPWNDFGTELYKPMVMAYPSATGLVDTLGWEGFREGIDDMRYATALRLAAEEALASGDLDRVYEGRKVRQWFILLDGASMNLDTIRLEMIEKLSRLQALKEKNVTPAATNR